VLSASALKNKKDNKQLSIVLSVFHWMNLEN